jgi:hypothetical protein
MRVMSEQMVKARYTTLQLLARIGIASLGLAMIACNTQHATYTPDGRRGFAISCGGYLSSWSSCLVQAGRACGSRGYDKVEGSEEELRLLIACKQHTNDP